LERQVRALHPHIGARVTLADGTLLGVCRAALAGNGSLEGVPAQLGSAEAGAIERGLTAREGRLRLGCATGALELLEIQPPGGRPMDGASYLCGHGLPGA
jgi:methionyl-tRNA formyltransferase